MQMAVISCASDQELKPGFHMPFIESAHYLGMQYIGDVHAWIENDQVPKIVKERLEAFSQKIQS